MFFKVNNVIEAKKLPTMGDKMYALQRSIVSPRKSEIVHNLAKQLDPKPIVIAERFKFREAEQQEWESMRDFLARLKKMAHTCGFGDYRKDAIRDRFVCGLKERGTIQRKLVAAADLTLHTADERSCADELTENETTALHGGNVEEAKTLECPATILHMAKIFLFLFSSF